MALKILVVAFGMIVAASPVLATSPEPNAMTSAPIGNANTKYCLRVEPVTGTRLEFVRCWTRQEWAERDVDVDREWAENGVAVIS